MTALGASFANGAGRGVLLLVMCITPGAERSPPRGLEPKLFWLRYFPPLQSLSMRRGRYHLVQGSGAVAAKIPSILGRGPSGKRHLSAPKIAPNGRGLLQPAELHPSFTGIAATVAGCRLFALHLWHLTCPAISLMNPKKPFMCLPPIDFSGA